MKRLLVLFTLILFADAVVWTTKSPLPQALAGAGCVIYNDTVYVIGGRDSAGNRYATNYIYDPYADSWSTRASMTYARAHINCAVVNGKIYAIGGWAGSTASSMVEEYDPSTNSWLTRTPMPTARYTYGLAVVNNKIYVIGGMNMSSQVFNTVEEYDPSSDTWTTRAIMPTARYGPGCAVYHDSIYVFGGATVIGGGLTSVNQCYDPASDTWTAKANMPTARYCLAGFTLQNCIWALGGYNFFNYYTTLEMYYPPGNSWVTDFGMQYARQSIQVAKLDEQYIYVIGGWNNGALNYNEEGWFEIGIAEQDVSLITITAGPNPFRDRVSIACCLPQGAKDLKLQIFDITGSLVKDLSRGVHDALRPVQVTWDGRDNQGRMLPSGTYLLTVNTGGTVQTEKLMLIK